MKDLQTVTEILDRQVDESTVKYFDYVEHRLKEALDQVQHAKTKFISSGGDHHAVQELVHELSRLDLGFERAISIVNKIAVVREEKELIEQLQEEAEE